MTSTMTGRERVLAALKGEECDRLCWAPLVDDYFTTSLPAQGYPQGDVTDACLLVGADVIERHTPSYHTVLEKTISRQVTRTGNHEVEVLETPVGRLVAERGYPLGSMHVVRWPVQNIEDVKVWQYITEHTHFRRDYATFEACDRRVGEHGIATASGVFTPITHFLEDLSGIEKTYYLMADHLDEMEACFEVMHAKNLERYHVLAESPSPVIIDYEDTSSTMISPAYYKRYCAPLIDEYARICHTEGKLFITHMCGKLSKFNAQLRDGLQDGIDSLCPPTTGDLWAHEARAAWGTQKIILGGIEPPAIERMSVEETRSYILKILDGMPTLTRFILSTGDATAHGTPVANLRAISEIVRDYPWK
jgi:uroporphyrinogen-III decarboxylase